MAKQKNGIMEEIKELHGCIKSDQNQLAKLYKKAVLDIKKKTGNVMKLVAKAKKQVCKANKNKKTSPKAYQTALAQMDSLKKELAAAKAEQSAIVTGNKHVVSLQKMLLQFDKNTTKSKTTSKPKKRRQMHPKKSTEAAHAESI